MVAKYSCNVMVWRPLGSNFGTGSVPRQETGIGEVKEEPS